MKFLKQHQNNNFYFDENNELRHTNLPMSAIKIQSDCENELNQQKSVKIFKTGALLSVKSNEQISYLFIKNNGVQLFKIQETELNEMENNIYDILAYPCVSGVLVVTQYYDKTFHMDYFTYTGSKFSGSNLIELDKRVRAYEKLAGIVYKIKQEKPDKKDDGNEDEELF